MLGAALNKHLINIHTEHLNQFFKRIARGISKSKNKQKTNNLKDN